MCLHQIAGKGTAVLRELEGKLYAGHETFDWLLAVISYTISAEVCLLPSVCLSEQRMPAMASLRGGHHLQAAI